MGRKENMQISDSGLKFIEQFESLQLNSYADIVGRWTVGYGHTLNVIPGMVITQEQAEQFLASDLASAEAAINANVRVDLTQNQFDACCSLVFNIGNGAFKQSTLLQLLNQGDFTNAALQFVRWDKAAGKVVAGLLRRRQAETDLFNKDQNA